MNYETTQKLRSYLCNEFTHQTPKNEHYFNWSFFFTLTTQDIPLTEKAAQRLMHRFTSLAQYEQQLGDRALKVFWVLERFKRRDGYHIHGLISLPKNNALCGHWGVRILDDYYQRATGLFVTMDEQGNRHYSGNYERKHRVQFVFIGNNPEKEKRSILYCTKYLFKDLTSDWYLDISGPDYDRRAISTQDVLPRDKKEARLLGIAYQKQAKDEELGRMEKYRILANERKSYFAYAREGVNASFLVREVLPQRLEKNELKRWLEMGRTNTKSFGLEITESVPDTRKCPHFNNFPTYLCAKCAK